MKINGCFCVLIGLKLALVTVTSNGMCRNHCLTAGKKWYYLDNSTYEYHLTDRRSYADCQPECKELGHTASFAPFDPRFKTYGTFKSKIIWIKTDPSCEYLLNEDIMQANCSYKFRCLCRRDTYNLTTNNRTNHHDKSDVHVNQGRCKHNRTIQKNFTYNHQDYFVTNDKSTYRGCSEMCLQSGAEGAELSMNVLSIKPFKQLRGIRLWVFREGATNDRVCYFAYLDYMLENNDCNYKLHCLCQHAVGNSTSKTGLATGVTKPTVHTNEYTASNWIEINDRHYFINNVNLSYKRTTDYCKKLGGSIVSFTNPIQYILLQRNIPLVWKYWVGGGIGQGKCIVLDAIGQPSLHSAHCDMKIYGICSRVANVSRVLTRPAFVKLMENMTVNSRKTSKMDRKLNCAHDNRTSAQAIGAVIGIGVIAFTGSLFILSDLQNVYRKCKRNW